MSNRMKDQRERYDSMGFIDVNSIIPEFRRPELLRIAAGWRAQARASGKPPVDNAKLVPGERVRYVGTEPCVVSQALTIQVGDEGYVVAKLGRLIQIALDSHTGPPLRSGARLWERAPDD